LLAIGVLACIAAPASPANAHNPTGGHWLWYTHDGCSFRYGHDYAWVNVPYAATEFRYACAASPPYVAYEAFTQSYPIGGYYDDSVYPENAFSAGVGGQGGIVSGSNHSICRYMVPCSPTFYLD
jgi:hypothetical protein